MITITSSAKNKDVRQILRNLSDQDFKFFGMGHLAYIKRVQVSGQSLFAVCGADGTPLSVVDSYDDARSILQHNELSTGTATLH